VGLEACRGVAAAHAAGVVHRDLKPSNLFIEVVRAGVQRVKVIDFGISRTFEGHDGEPEITGRGRLVGSPRYMAPEQLRSGATLDPRSDVWALGAILYELIAGVSPFGAATVADTIARILGDAPAPLRSKAPAASERVASIVDLCLSKDLVLRPSNAQALLEELEGAAEPGPLRLEVPSRPEAAPPVDSTTTSLEPDTPERDVRTPASASLAEVRVVTVVIARIGRADPDALAAAQAAVAGQHGRVDALVDGSLVMTVPSDGTPKEQAIRAARCAVALQGQLGPMPMALCTGQAVVRGRSPTGEVVDEAARVIAERPDDAIWADAPTARLLEGRFRIDAGRLGGELPRVSEVRTLLGKPTPCVGRDRDLDVLQAYYRECVDESVARVVLVTAPAGQGKTRLLQELGKRLRHGGAEVRELAAQADPLGTSASFGVLGPALRATAGLEPGEPLEAARRQVRAFFGRDFDEDTATRVSAFMGELVGVPFEAGTLPALDSARREPRLMADQMLVAWLDWLEVACEREPLLVTLEDLHWADPPSVQFVGAALRSMRDRPLMVLATARPTIHERFPGLWSEQGLVSIALPGLPRKACERLVTEALGDRASAQTRARLLDQADGNPFFLEELIRAADAGAGDLGVPLTVLGMLHARLDALGEEPKRILRAASVFGVEFPIDGVEAVLGEVDEEVLAGSLALLAEREVVYARHRDRARPTFAFRHALLHESAYALLTESDRQVLHLRTARWLETAGGAQAAIVAEHFERGGALAEAARWYRNAATEAFEGNDLANAIVCCERGIACGASGELLGELNWMMADARQWLVQFEAAVAPGREAMRLLPEGSPLWFRAAGTLTTILVVQGLVAESEELGRLVLEVSRKTPVDAAGAIGVAHVAREIGAFYRSDVAAQLFAVAKSHADRPDRPPLLEAWTLAAEAVLRRPEADLRYGRATLAAFRRAGDLRGIQMALGQLASDLVDFGALAEASDAFAETRAIADRLGMGVFGNDLVNEGILAAYLGRLDEAERLMRSGIREYEKQAEPAASATPRTFLGRLLADAGKYEEALEEIAQVIETLASSSHYWPMAFAARAVVELSKGNADAAVRTSVESVERLAANGTRTEEAYVLRVHAEALHAAGRQDEARACIRSARDDLLRRAEAIAEPALRPGFLQNVPDHARIVELAREWGC
jgi:tetratricopeptide (TPR) repeat protein